MELSAIAAATTVNHLTSRSPHADVALMHVLAVLAFAVGGILGFFAGFFFFLQGSSWTA